MEPEVERMGAEGDSGLSLMALMTIFNKVHVHSSDLRDVYMIVNS